MNIDPYASCPCGSGKQFKWCCKDIYADIDRAFQQEEENQHESALRIMDEVIAKHPGNPEVYGRKAQLLFMHEKVDEGEAVLQKAFDINPAYPWGLLMQARLRLREGEMTGALILARRAAEAYDPRAIEYLAQVYGLIADCELSLNRPVAAHAALRILLRCQPGDDQLRQQVQATFGPESRLPACARQPYELRSPPANLDPARRSAWDQVLKEVASPRLAALASAFERLTQQDAGDAAAWYNLGVVRAWLGDNRKAIDALDRHVEVEPDEAKASVAAALGEVLRCGQGLEDVADHVSYQAEYRLRDLEALSKLLQQFHEDHRLIQLQSSDRSTFAAMLLETPTSLVAAGTSGPKERKLAGYVLIVGDQMRLWGPRKEAFDRLREEVKTKTNLGVQEGPVETLHCNWADTVADALLFPIGATSEDDARTHVAGHAQRYFEETWIHRPLKTLAGNNPVDAAGHRTLRKKLVGVIRFLQDCASEGVLQVYDFERLRRKLGLDGAAAAPAAPGAAAPASGPTLDLAAMGAAELAGLAVEGLSDAQVEQAYQAAQKLDADELTTHFARALVARPGPPATDRYPVFSYLVSRALREGNADEALSLVNEGERIDCEHNEGRRRNDYELRRGQVYAKRKDGELAFDVFTRLIERSPDNVKYRGSAAEAMLSLHQPQRARTFAEGGLAVARQQNDRDSEQYLMELVAAAKKQGG